MTTQSSAQSTARPLVDVQDLTVQFQSEDSTVHAVNGVNFHLNAGEVMCILGESGSGKSVTMRALMRLLPEERTKISGQMRVAEHDVLTLSDTAMADIRGPVVSMIFQEPMTAFDPVFTIGDQIVETIVRHMKVSRSAARARALELLEMVQIPSARTRLDNYPHEMSGGMRQRAMIALALSCSPSVLLADEPTTALDATVQIQILLLLRELRDELGMAIVFVTHDIGVAIEVADKMAVMYAGKFVESGPLRDVMNHTKHPYTLGLMASTVKRSNRGQRLQAIDGSPPDLAALPLGCSFSPRCSYKRDQCDSQAPSSSTFGSQHEAACFFPRT